MPAVHRVEPSTRLMADFAADYGDAYSTVAVPGRPARAWAGRSLVAQHPTAQNTFGTLVWHGVLGFDLAASDTPGTLVGWNITTDRPDLFVLETDGSLMAGRMVFEATAASTTWTTMLRFHGATGRRIWAVAGNAHRALAPRLLARAAG